MCIPLSDPVGLVLMISRGDIQKIFHFFRPMMKDDTLVRDNTNSKLLYTSKHIFIL